MGQTRKCAEPRSRTGLPDEKVCNAATGYPVGVSSHTASLTPTVRIDAAKACLHSSASTHRQSVSHTFFSFFFSVAWQSRAHAETGRRGRGCWPKPLLGSGLAPALTVGLFEFPAFSVMQDATAESKRRARTGIFLSILLPVPSCISFPLAPVSSLFVKVEIRISDLSSSSFTPGIFAGPQFLVEHYLSIHYTVVTIASPSAWKSKPV